MRVLWRRILSAFVHLETSPSGFHFFTLVFTVSSPDGVFWALLTSPLGTAAHAFSAAVTGPPGGHTVRPPCVRGRCPCPTRRVLSTPSHRISYMCPPGTESSVVLQDAARHVAPCCFACDVPHTKSAVVPPCESLYKRGPFLWLLRFSLSRV